MDSAISMILLSTDAQALSAVDSAAKAYEIHREICFTAAEAFNLAQQRRFEFLILDLEVPEVADLLRHGNAWSHPYVVIGLTSKAGSLRRADGEQVHLVVQKPFTSSLMERSLRAAYKLLLNKTRAAFRYQVEITASATVIEKGRRHALHNVLLQDLSTTGLRMKTDSLVFKDSTVFVDFQLPDTKTYIHAVGRIIWTGNRGEAGMQFLSIAAAEFDALREWLSSRCPWTTDLPVRASELARHEEARVQ